MMKYNLNIISFNVPFPANYGGIIDVFYRIKALHKSGVNIILHTFEYGREHAEELNKYCSEVYYYKRKTGILSQLSMVPYIVNSRQSETLIKRLLENDYPILFEGIHTCFYLPDSRLSGRIKFVRSHNIEYIYYRELARNSTKPLLKIYFRFEAFRLKRYEPVLRHADYNLTVTATEFEYFKRYGKVILMPSSHPNEQVTVVEESKPYVLYHGDLSSPENINNAVFLINQLAKKDTSIPWVIAGLNPDKAVYKAAHDAPNVTVKANLSDAEMLKLLQEAHINILYTTQAVGLKLKLLNALFNCHYCLATPQMLLGSGLEELCVIISTDPDDILKEIRHYLSIDFPVDEIKRRKLILKQQCDNIENAQKIILQLKE